MLAAPFMRRSSPKWRSSSRTPCAAALVWSGEDGEHKSDEEREREKGGIGDSPTDVLSTQEHPLVSRCPIKLIY
jgi:hypothetical protein